FNNIKYNNNNITPWREEAEKSEKRSDELYKIFSLTLSTQIDRFSGLGCFIHSAVVVEGLNAMTVPRKQKG
ncbi:TPA: hypothetical protein ACGFXF_003379, partial [Vibrio cholerae]